MLIKPDRREAKEILQEIPEAYSIITYYLERVENFNKLEEMLLNSRSETCIGVLENRP